MGELEQELEKSLKEIIRYDYHSEEQYGVLGKVVGYLYLISENETEEKKEKLLKAAGFAVNYDIKDLQDVKILYRLCMESVDGLFQEE